MQNPPSGLTVWRSALRRLARFRKPRSTWSAFVPLIALAAGLLFTTSARTADGTALREDRRPKLAQIVNEERDRVTASQQKARELAAAVKSQTDALARTDGPIRAESDRAEQVEPAAGFTALHGPGLTVRLDDAPQRTGDRPDGVRPDDLVVHQGDVQAVVNALWTGGAEAMSIMGVRVLST
ncbi:MAG TPA: DUF881 domain-containing protein, partial [Asanoa sp.]|nr:DUF881 domain-containing protein [Asanoa sp.]